jgi:hypothetical protein
MKIAIRIAATAAIAAAATMPAAGQKTPVADIAKQMSGTWTINLSLSPGFAPGRARGGGARTPARAPLFQRGGRGGGGGNTPTSNADLTPEELAERTAMMQLRQIAPKITITATAETFSLEDGRTETCTVNGKGQKFTVNDVQVEFKCRWDKDRLRQEFATIRSKLIRTWGVEESGHLVLKAKLEGIGQNTPEATAVFDRSQ